MFGAYRNPSDANQQWGFSPTGQIYSLSKPSLVLTYVGDHDVEDITADEKSPQTISPEKQESHGLENLNFMDELELDGPMSITEGFSQQPSPSLSDQTEESTETGLAKLKDEFLGQNYSLVLLPKKQGEGTQRLVLNDMADLIYAALSSPGSELRLSTGTMASGNLLVLLQANMLFVTLVLISLDHYYILFAPL